MFADTACHWTAQNGQKLQYVAVKVFGSCFLGNAALDARHGLHLNKSSQQNMADSNRPCRRSVWSMRHDMGNSVLKIANAVESFTSSVTGRTVMRVQLRGIHGHYFSGVVIALVMSFAVDDRAAGESWQECAVSRSCIHFRNIAGNEKSDMANNMNSNQKERRRADTLIVIDRRNGKALLYGQLILFLGLLATVLWLLID